MNVTVILFGTFGFLLLIGAPITVSLGVAAASALYFLGNDLVALVQIAYTSSKCSNLVKIKEDENFNHRNT